jgi:transposase InsO family protein
MNIHKNARLTPHGRAEVVREVCDQGRSARAVGRARGVSEKTVRKWVARAAAGEALVDRSSRPHGSPHATPPSVVLRIEVLRRQRHTCAEIAAAVGVSRATVARIVARCGWSRLRVLELPPPTSRRYERAVPGELVHLDIKKLGRIVRPGHRVTGDRRDTVQGAGWEFAHMAVDDASRLAVGEVLPDETAATAVGFLGRLVRDLRRLGVRVAAVMTDNGSCYKSHRFAAACRRLRLRHLRTRRHTPRTNGKVERFIKTSLLEWAYARVYRHSDERRAALEPWLHYYNWHRRHTSLAGQAPVTRVLSTDNLLRFHS